MKTFIFVLSLVFLLVGCTEESKVKNAAIEAAKERFQAQAREDIAKSVIGKENLQKTAVKVLTDKSEFNVQEVEIHGPQASVAIVVSTIPHQERETLIEIMAKLDDKKEATFNVSNALNLIRGQLQLDAKSEESIYKIKLQKQDGWKAQP